MFEARRASSLKDLFELHDAVREKQLACVELCGTRYKAWYWTFNPQVLQKCEFVNFSHYTVKIKQFETYL